jgi:hypothetical protein
MNEKSNTHMVAVKCPKCKETLFLECESCQEKSKWILNDKEILCGCGEKYIGWLCDCGEKIMPKDFQIVDNELVEKKRKALLKKRKKKVV